MEPEKLDLRSHDIAEDKRQELLRLFPEIRTEGGKIDAARLKLALGEIVDVGKERYGMIWPGKADCFKTIQTPSLGTLRPCPEESVNFNTTENLIIGGDNLEVLKLLQKSYLGKVKMIYIDPPYNTGNDFIYPDDYSESLQTYLEYTGQVDAEGKKFSTNAETDGRFHSKWLNMMYPRLYLARNLLVNDGFCFVSIDENENYNLRHIMDEIFGQENLVGVIVWKKGSGGNDTDFSYSHEQVIIYRKSDTAKLGRVAQSEQQLGSYQNPDNDTRGDWTSSDYTSKWTKDERPNLWYPIMNPNTEVECLPPEGRTWAYGKEETGKNIAGNLLWWGKNGSNERPRYKRFRTVTEGTMIPRSWWDSVGTNEDGFEEFRSLGFTKDDFPHPKPVSLIKKLITIGTDEDGVVLDFFAGSGTTAQAVLEFNRELGGNRKFILVQLPEPTGRSRYTNLAELVKERGRRVIKKLNKEDEDKLDLDSEKRQDLGFRVFKLTESNFKPWNADVPHDAPMLEKQLDLHVDHIRDGRTADDLLYEILLKSGFPLTTSVEPLKLASKTVHSVAGGALFICLERALTLELIRAMAEKKPERVVCLDEGFASNDQLKANAVQIFKTKGITSFKTV